MKSIPSMSYDEPDMNIRFFPKELLKFLLCCIGLLIFLNSLALIGKLGFGHPTMMGFFELVNFDKEANIPTCYSAFVIFLCSMVLFVLGSHYWKETHKFKYHWVVLALLFLFLAFDEIMQIHERLVYIFRDIFNATGFFFFSWVIPALVLLPVLLLCYIKFLLDLPKETARLFLISGGVYVLGVVGLEMVSAKIYFNNTRVLLLEEPRNLMYETAVMLEESLEMLGMALFLFALLSFLEKKVGSINIILKD